MKHSIRFIADLARLLAQPASVLGAFLLLIGLEAKAATFDSIRIESGMGLRNSNRAGRNAFGVDPVQGLMVRGQFRLPVLGERVAGEGTNNAIWERVLANTNGWFEHAVMRGGYFVAPVVVASERSMILEAQGHTMVYVNGEPRAGDVYLYGYLKLPVMLKKGTNLFVFQCGRGRLKAELVPPTSDLQLDFSDPTLPDLVVGERPQHWAGLVVINSTAQ